MQATRRHLRGLRPCAALLLLALGGCLGEPEIEDRWTRLDVIEVDAGATDPETGGAALRVRGRITYRSILTGSVAAEVRASDALGAKDVDLRPEADRRVTTRQIQTLLESSAAAGSASRAVTGFDHLIQEIELVLPGDVPDPAPGGAVFVVLYFGQAEERERPDGEEITVVVPADFEGDHILPDAYLLREGEERSQR